MTFKTRMSVLALSTPVLAFVLVGGLMGANSAQSSGRQTYQHLRVFDDVVDLVMNNYVGEVQVDKVMDGAMRGLADGLDPDSAFLNPGQVKAVEAGEAAPQWSAAAPDSRWLAIAAALLVEATGRPHGPLAGWASTGSRSFPPRPGTASRRATAPSARGAAAARTSSASASTPGDCSRSAGVTRK